jgi:hypothetical protein
MYLHVASTANVEFIISTNEAICVQCKPEIISFCKARGLVIARIVFASRVLPWWIRHAAKEKSNKSL